MGIGERFGFDRFGHIFIIHQCRLYNKHVSLRFDTQWGSAESFSDMYSYSTSPVRLSQLD